MFSEGLSLLATGMGTVFLFLIILWFSVSLMGVVVKKLNELFPEQIAAVQKAAVKISSNVEVAIAIAAAKMRK